MAKPLHDGVGQSSNVAPPNRDWIGWQLVHGRIKEAGVNRIRIRTAYQLNLGHIVRRNHAGVAGVELVLQTLVFQPLMDRVDPLRHNQRRPLRALGQKITHGAIQRTGHPHSLSLLRHQRKRTVDPSHRLRGPAQHPLPGLLQGHVMEQLSRRIDQVHQTLDVLICHVGVLLRVHPVIKLGQKKRKPPDNRQQPPLGRFSA